MTKLYYDYKRDGKVVHIAHAETLKEADAHFRQHRSGEEPSFYGLHIRQDPEELKKLKPPRIQRS